jgi:hypothetical protein
VFPIPPSLHPFISTDFWPITVEEMYDIWQVINLDSLPIQPDAYGISQWENG